MRLVGALTIFIFLIILLQSALAMTVFISSPQGTYQQNVDPPAFLGARFSNGYLTDTYYFKGNGPLTLGVTNIGSSVNFRVKLDGTVYSILTLGNGETKYMPNVVPSTTPRVLTIETGPTTSGPWTQLTAADGIMVGLRRSWAGTPGGCPFHYWDCYPGNTSIKIQGLDVNSQIISASLIKIDDNGNEQGVLGSIPENEPTRARIRVRNTGTALWLAAPNYYDYTYYKFLLDSATFGLHMPSGDLGFTGALPRYSTIDPSYDSRYYMRGYRLDDVPIFFSNYTFGAGCEQGCYDSYIPAGQDANIDFYMYPLNGTGTFNFTVQMMQGIHGQTIGNLFGPTKTYSVNVVPGVPKCSVTAANATAGNPIPITVTYREFYSVPGVNQTINCNGSQTNLLCDQSTRTCTAQCAYGLGGPQTFTATINGTNESATCSTTKSYTPLPTAVPGGPYNGIVNTPIAIHGSATGGTPPYTFTWSSPFTSYCHITPAGNGPDKNVSCDMEFYPTSIRLTVTDSLGNSDAKSALVYTVSAPQPIVNAGPDKEGIINSAVTLSGSASNGTPPYTYSWSLSSNTAGCSFSGPVNGVSASVSCTGAGSATATLTVTDSLAASRSDSALITIYPNISVSAGSSVSFDANAQITASGSITGGKSPYNFLWSFSDANHGCSIISGANTLSPVFTCQYYGSLSLVLTATDSIHPNPSQGTAQLIIQSHPSCSLTLSRTTTSINSPISATISYDLFQSNPAITGYSPDTITCNPDISPVASTQVTCTNLGTRVVGTNTYYYGSCTAACSYSASGNTRTWASIFGYPDFTSCNGPNVTVLPSPALDANAGQDKSSLIDSLITLDGNSTGGVLPHDYNWSWIFNPSDYCEFIPASAQFTKTPQVRCNGAVSVGVKTLRLTVRDSISQTDFDDVNITITSPPVINGACGDENKTYLSSDTAFATNNFCLNGTPAPNPPAFPLTPGTRSSWQCLGSGAGHTDKECSVFRQSAVTPPSGDSNSILSLQAEQLGIIAGGVSTIKLTAACTKDLTADLNLSIYNASTGASTPLQYSPAKIPCTSVPTSSTVTITTPITENTVIAAVADITKNTAVCNVCTKTSYLSLVPSVQGESSAVPDANILAAMLAIVFAVFILARKQKT